MTEETLAVIVRLCNRAELKKLFPRYGTIDHWCEHKHGTLYHNFQYCTCFKGHDGPHIDYDLADETLVWITTNSKVFKIEQGEVFDE